MTPLADNLAKSAVSCFVIAQDMQAGMMTARQARAALRDMVNEAMRCDRLLQTELD